MGQKWVKTRFSKSDPRLFGMLKKVFLARFEPVLMEFSPFHHMYAPLCALRTYQERAVSWATWLKNEFRGHLVHPQPPTFYGFQASASPNETRRPPYQWSLRAIGGQPSPRTVGANGGSTRVPGAKKMRFSKVVPRPLGMLKTSVFRPF